MKIRHLALLLSAILVLPSMGPAAAESPDGLGMSHGQFGLEVIRKAKAERFFQRTVTAVSATERLAALGFSPDGGWRIDEDLQWAHLESAYSRLLRVLGIEAPPRSGADLALTRRVDNATPAAGEPIVYTTTLMNHGPEAAEDIRVEFDVPRGVALAGGEPGPDGKREWRVDGLAPGDSVQLMMTGTVDPGAVGRKIPLPARVATSGQADPDPGNNSTSAGIVVPKPGLTVADLSLRMAADNVVPAEDETVTFTISVQNDGPDRATGIRVRSILPPGLVLTGTGGAEFGDGVWRIGELGSGQNHLLTLTAEADVDTEQWFMTNIVEIAECDQPDPNDDNNRYELKIAVRLLERIGDAARFALTPTTTERQPVSPTRPLAR